MCMSRMTFGFLDEPTFLSVSPMMEYHNQTADVEQIIPKGSQSSSLFRLSPFQPQQKEQKIVIDVPIRHRKKYGK